MLLAIECSSIELNSIMYIIKNILTIITIVAPILAIIMLAILFTKISINPVNNKLIHRLKNTIKALLIILFIPMIVNILMYALGSKTKISSCYTTSTKIDPNANYIKVNEDNRIKIVNEEEYEKGFIHQLDFSCTSKYIKSQFSCNTIHIVEHHYLDFNMSNMGSVISKSGSFDKYMNDLGGYFKEFYKEDIKKPTKAYDFQKISEYVFGMMYMYGFDYYNGVAGMKIEDVKYCKWGGNCIPMEEYEKAIKEAEQKSKETGKTVEPDIELPTATEDAFYPGQFMYINHGTFPGASFDSGISGNNMTTNCNNSVDMVYTKAKILGTSERPYLSSEWQRQVADKKNKVISDFKDLQIGDILHFFDQPVDSSNPSTWGGWTHVAYVGQIDYQKGIITAYDGGSYFTSNRNYKWSFDRNNTTTTLHGYAG